MDEQDLSQLSIEQHASLNDDQKAIFCSLNEADQKFFSQSFKPGDLPGALTRKGEILKRNQADRDRMDQLKAIFAQRAESRPASGSAADNILTGIGAAVGIGAAAAIIATDSTASWRGVKPNDLVSPLRTEFNNDKTHIDVGGNPQALMVTVQIIGENEYIPAVTVNLSSENDGTLVKISDLSSHGTFETIKAGGKKLLGIAADGLRIVTRSKFGGVSPDEIIQTASRTLSEGTELAEVAGNLKLKDRAWKVIKQAAETIETNYFSQLDKERQMRYSLEKSWDNFYNCPTCGVPFQPEDSVCRVCASPRTEPPNKSDPRKL
jgi:hypothetical protein